MQSSEKILKVNGVFKHYDWGGKTFIPSLLNRSNEERKPYAEYWLGSDLHEDAGKLPYLFKVMDVEKIGELSCVFMKIAAEPVLSIRFSFFV